MQTLWQDLRFAVRMLRKNPAFTIVAVLTLALGIGANTAIFSVVNAVLLRPLPYKEPSRILSLNQTDLPSKINGIPVSFTKFKFLREQSQVFESSAAYYTLGLSLLTQREPEAISGARVSADFFEVLGITPARGRFFSPEEEVPGGSDVAVVSDGFWHSHFAGDPAILGKTLAIDGKSVTVVGILPASFQFPLQYPEPDIWLPRVFETSLLTPQQVHTGAGYLAVIGRMRPGQTLTRAQAELDTINARYREQFGGYVDANRYVIVASSLEDSLSGQLRPSLFVLLAAVGFVLLIACVNVASLLLARASSRAREIGIRRALGASPLRLMRQLLSESLLLSLCGGALGIGLAAVLTPVLRAVSPGAVPRLAETRLDVHVLLFSFALCVVTGVVFGFVPSLQAAGTELQESLKEGGRGSSEGAGQGKFRALLVVSELCIALVLMTGAGLLIESFAHLVHVNPGLTPQGLMTFPLALPATRYPQPPQQAEFVRQLLERVRAIPEVHFASVTSFVPLSGGGRMVFFCPEGRVCQGIGKDPIIALYQVGTNYFETMGTPILRGRAFNNEDAAGGMPVVIINATTANRYFPGQDPLGKHLANSRDMKQREIVGVAGDMKFNSLSAANAEIMYWPMAQLPWSQVTLLVRSQSNSQAMVNAVRGKIAEVDSTLPVSNVASMEQIVATSVAQPRLIMQLVGIFAGLALALAAVGIYGVMAHSVNSRKQEMGIRVALGARPVEILRLVVGQGMRLTLLGVALGVVASFALTRLLATLLFHVRATDPLIFSGAAFVLIATALFACYLPARRATRVDPIEVLRYE
jgi:putative ABC transport system permease protein